MKRREMLLTTSAAVLGLSGFPLGWAAAAENKNCSTLPKAPDTSTQSSNATATN